MTTLHAPASGLPRAPQRHTSKTLALPLCTAADGVGNAIVVKVCIALGLAAAADGVAFKFGQRVVFELDAAGDSVALDLNAFSAAPAAALNVLQLDAATDAVGR